VGIHARDVVAAGMGQSEVQAVWRPSRGVAYHAYPRVDRSEPLQDLARAVVRVALRKDELDLAVRQALCEHRRHRLLDHRSLVQDRRQHAHGDRGRDACRLVVR
jgi:hypothetical protein